MTHHETSVLSSRLQLLADDLAPRIDVVAEVRGARERHRRQRRTRLAVGVAAVIALIGVGVPTAVGSLSSAPEPGREVAGPSPTPSGTDPAGDREDARRVDVWQDTLDERAEIEARLGPEAWRLRTALQARSTPVSVEAPERFVSCPDWAPALSAALGIEVQARQAPVGGGRRCLWGPAASDDMFVQLELVTGTSQEQLVRDVNSEATRTGCYPAAMPGTEKFTALSLCEGELGTTWRLRLLDTSESAFWLLSVGIEPRHAGDDVPAVVAAIDVLDATW